MLAIQKGDHKAFQAAHKDEQRARLQTGKPRLERKTAGQQGTGHPAERGREDPDHAGDAALLYAAHILLTVGQQHEAAGPCGQARPLQQPRPRLIGEQPAGHQHGDGRRAGDDRRRGGSHALLPLGQEAACQQDHEHAHPGGMDPVLALRPYPAPREHQEQCQEDAADTRKGPATPRLNL